MKKLIILLINVLLPYIGSANSSYPQREDAPQREDIKFTVLQTTGNHTLKAIKTTPFTPHYVPALNVLDLDAAKPSHKYQGVGICMPDASCWIISQLNKDTKDALLKDAFSKEGLNFSRIRLNCGSSDYATALYNYNDTKNDVNMKHFSIARDKQYMIPLIKEILQMRPDMFLFSSIWSAPGWMKDSGLMCGGKLLDKYMPAFANYWAAYLKAYKEKGININAITVQNEPLTDQGGANPATLVSTEQEIQLAGKLLPEAFQKAGVNTKIWIYDHNYEQYERVLQELADENVRKNIDAVAWHPYSGKPMNMKKVREAYPNIPFHLTERGMNYKDIATQNEKWCADLVFNALNNGCSSYCAWCLALDEDGQPVTGKFYCRGLYEVNLENNTFKSTPLCTLFHQFSPYVEKNADIMDIEQPDKNLTTITFRNPNGQYVIIVACDNMGTNRQRLQIKYKGQYLAYALPLNTWSLSTIIID